MSSPDQLTSVHLYVLLYLIILLISLLVLSRQVPTEMSTILLGFCLKPSCDQRQSAPAAPPLIQIIRPSVYSGSQIRVNNRVQATPHFLHTVSLSCAQALWYLLKLRLGWELYLKSVFTTIVNKDRLQYDLCLAKPLKLSQC